jgi:YD repeat-containing protein
MSLNELGSLIGEPAKKSFDIVFLVISVTDAEGHVTAYTYDDLGRLVLTVSPDTGTTSYSYDEAGNLRYKVQNGASIEYQYDVLGRLTNILYNDSTQNGNIWDGP